MSFWAASASAIPIVGIEDPTNNTARFSYAWADYLTLRVEVENTSNYNARITGFGFDIDGGVAVGLWSVQGTLRDDDWSFHFDAIPGPGDRDGFAITGVNLNGGNPNSGIAVGLTAIFNFAGLFLPTLTIDNILVRFQQTGPDGSGSDFGVACVARCVPATQVPEPSGLGSLGLGLVIVGLVARLQRRRSARRRASAGA